MTDRIPVPLAEATAAQLREFAQTILGIEVHKNDPAHSLKAKIAQAGYDKDAILVAPELTERQVTPAVASPVTADDEFVTVVIEKTSEKGGDQPVFVSVNGRGMLIARGKPQKIRRFYEEALRNASAVIYEQEERADGLPGDLIPREVSRFPYRIVA